MPCASLGPRPAARVRTLAPDDCNLVSRVGAEFREMPGLMLTLPQAARLFSIDVPQCERVLNALVERGELRTKGREFARA